MADEQDLFHDFLKEPKHYLLLSGYWQLQEGGFRSWLYAAYRAYVLLFTGYIVFMAWTGVVLSRENTVEVVQAIHMSDLAILCFFSLVSKLRRDAWLTRTMDIFRSGVYLYEDEPRDLEHEEIKRETVENVSEMTRTFSRLIVFVACTNTVFVPLMNLFMVERDGKGTVLNPYLPQPFYMPFDTRTVMGYSLAYGINVLFMIVLCSLVICMDTIHLSCTLQLKAQYKILNHSLGNLERRAVQRMFRDETIETDSISVEDLYSNLKFQECLCLCLRANIMHHQALLRLNWTMEKYVGLIFFFVVCLASNVLACHLISILENPPLYAIANFIVTLSCELLYTYHYCWYGEDLTKESEEVYNSLYYTRWYSYDERFKKHLALVMCNTRIPAKIKTVAFGFTASLHTFSSNTGWGHNNRLFQQCTKS